MAKSSSREAALSDVRGSVRSIRCLAATVRKRVLPRAAMPSRLFQSIVTAWKRGRSNRFGRFRLSDHLHEDCSRVPCIFDFSQKSDAPAVNSIARLEPEMKAQPVDGSDSSLVGSFACKPARDQTKSIGMIGIHVPNDGGRGLGQRI